MTPEVQIAAEGGTLSGETEERLRRAIEAVLSSEGIGAGEVSLTLLDDTSMLRLNREWLAHAWVTDVLSFSLEAPEGEVLADVYVGVEQAARQAADAGVPLSEELVRLAIHGTLHALGYDHPEGEDREESALFRRQEELVRMVMAEGR